MGELIRADARHLPLADESVDLIVSSPPYFSLRSYTDAGEHYPGQIGSEDTPQEWLANLLECTREMVRVLKPSGSIWIDLGDKYDSGTSAPRTNPGTIKDGTGQGYHLAAPRFTAGRPKSLMLLPERFRIACVDELGLIARAVVVWHKANGLPESVQDRVRRSHEDLVHLVKRPRYYSAMDAIREPHIGGWGGRGDYDTKMRKVPGSSPHSSLDRTLGNPLGKLPGSVWTISTEPLSVPTHLGVDHFAAMPTEWPRRIILGWSPSGICLECGEGRRPVVVRGPQPPEPMHRQAARLAPGEAGNGTIGFRASRLSGQEWNAFRSANPDRITGYACTCPEPSAPTRPAVVLDPFGGTGTTALVASVLGRLGISVDMSADYCRLARWRVNDPGERARAMRVAKPPPVIPDQLELWPGAVETTGRPR